MRLEDGAGTADLASAPRISPHRYYHTVFSGFAARLTDGQLASLRRRGDAVLSVEQDTQDTMITNALDGVQPDPPS